LSFTAIVQIAFIIPAIKARAVFVGVFFVCYTVIAISTFLKLKIPDRALRSVRILLLVIALTSLISTGISKMEFVSIKHPKISNKKIDTSSSIFVRIYAWEKTWLMIKEKPLLGVGGGNWKIILPRYGLEGEQLENGAYQYIRPHNDYLWVLAENGIMGFLAYLLIFISAINQSIRLLRTSEHNKFLIIVLISGIVGYMIIAFFSFPKERVYHSLLLMTYLALITSFSAKKQIKGHFKINIFTSLYVKIALIIFALSLSLLVLTYTIKRMKSEIHFYFAYQARLHNQPNLTIAAINKIDPNIFNISPTGIPVQWYRGNAYFQNGRIQRAFRDFSEAAKTHPYHIFVLNNLGTCYEMNSNISQAISYYSKVLTISPFYCETLLNLSAIYYNQNEYLQALKILSRCLPGENNSRYSEYYDLIMNKLNAANFE
jgi:tetratricopeptide (TPR) repeat protein